MRRQRRGVINIHGGILPNFGDVDVAVGNGRIILLVGVRGRGRSGSYMSRLGRAARISGHFELEKYVSGEVAGGGTLTLRWNLTGRLGVVHGSFKAIGMVEIQSGQSMDSVTMKQFPGTQIRKALGSGTRPYQICPSRLAAQHFDLAPTVSQGDARYFSRR